MDHRLAHVDVVGRRLLGVDHHDRRDAGLRKGFEYAFTGVGQRNRIERGRLAGDENLAGLVRSQARGGFGEEAEDHLFDQRRPLMRGKFRRPVVIRVALQHDLRLCAPLHKTEWPGADRVAPVIRAVLLQRGGRRNAQPLAGSVAQEGGVGCGKLHDRRVVVQHFGFDVLMIDEQCLTARFEHSVTHDVVERRLDRSGGEGRAVVEGDILAQGEGKFGEVVVGLPVARQPGMQCAIRRHCQQRVKEVHQDELLLHVDGVARIERFRLGAETDGQDASRGRRDFLADSRRRRWRRARGQHQAGHDEQCQQNDKTVLYGHANSPQFDDYR